MKLYTQQFDVGNDYHQRTCYFKDKECTILHRDDGPACEYKDGRIKEWYINGKRHREDGPAIIFKYSNGVSSVFYYLNGKKYSKEKYWAKIRLGAFV